MVGWDKICRPFEVGGLGIKKLRHFNSALLGKWIWRFVYESGALWRRVIVSRREECWGSWLSEEPRGRYGVGVWKSIYKVRGEVWGQIQFVVGDGSRVRFWSDDWSGVGVLCEKFPRLYGCSSDRCILVRDCMTCNEIGVVWVPSFWRELNDWEVGECVNLMTSLQGMQIRRGSSDSVGWSRAQNGKFSVRSLYQFLEGNT